MAVIGLCLYYCTRELGERILWSSLSRCYVVVITTLPYSHSRTLSHINHPCTEIFQKAHHSKYVRRADTKRMWNRSDAVRRRHHKLQTTTTIAILDNWNVQNIYVRISAEREQVLASKSVKIYTLASCVRL